MHRLTVIGVEELAEFGDRENRERQGCGKEAVGREAIMDCSVDGAYDIGWWTGGICLRFN